MNSKVIVTGPGKCGTSYFMKLLSELGFDTGFDPTDASVAAEHSGEKLYRGFEWTIRGKHARKEMPHVIKSPKLCIDLLDRANTWGWDIEHVYILLREYKDVGNHQWHFRHSRFRLGTESEEEHKTKFEDRAAKWVGGITYTVISEEIPHTFLMFPRIVTDPEYLWSTCGLFKDIPYEKFKAAFDRIANTDNVHWGLEER